MDWLKNIEKLFKEFIVWTTNHPNVYTTWKRYPIIVRCINDNQDECIHLLAVELLDEDIINVMMSSHGSIMGPEELIRDNELILQYFGSMDKAVVKNCGLKIFCIAYINI